MSFTGAGYDPSAYRDSVHRSTAPGMYMTTVLRQDPAGAFNDGHTAVESGLLGICGGRSSSPPCDFSSAPVISDAFVKTPRDVLYPEPTRQSNSARNIRGIGGHMPGPPPICAPREDTIAIPASSRDDAKTSHVPCVVRPMEQDAGLPPPAPDCVPFPTETFPDEFQRDRIPEVRLRQPPGPYTVIV